MSKLDLLEQHNNRNHIKNFLEHNNIPDYGRFTTTVKVNRFYLRNVDISINNIPQREWASIYIMWEDCGLANYREFNLYGEYRSDYNQIIFDSKLNTLTIGNQDPIHIIYTS